ncbi:tetratricopeptide repeat protein [bacterium]|nr:tetratricopeptide repeat protein [bacterium]
MRYIINPAIIILLTFFPAVVLFAQEENSDLAMAESFFDREDWENAARSYDRVIQAESETPFVLHRLAYSLLKCDHNMKARVVLERLIALNPDDDLAHYNLGILYWSTDRPLLAIPCFKSAVRIDSAWADAWYCLGLIYVDLERPDDAWRMWDRVLPLDADMAADLHERVSYLERYLNDPVQEW